MKRTHILVISANLFASAFLLIFIVILMNKMSDLENKYYDIVIILKQGTEIDEQMSSILSDHHKYITQNKFETKVK